MRDALTLTELPKLLALPDPEAAVALSIRMAVLDQVERIHERSYSERGIIAMEFERRQLWRHLTDPDTGQAFPSWSAWMACSDFLGCRRVNFESVRDMRALADVPQEKLIDVPKGNLQVLKQLSTKVRNQPDVLAAARSMPREAFEEKVEKEHPDQHLGARKVMRFRFTREEAKVVEEWIACAIENDVAGTREEAMMMAAETALEDWKS